MIKEIAKSEGMLAAIGDGIAVVDRTFKVLYENQVHKDMMGDHVGQYCYKAYAKKEGICGGCPVALTFKDGKVHAVQRELHTDTETRYVEITASPLKDSTGEIIAGIEVVRDITEHKQADQKLREREERYRLLFNSVSDAIFVHEVMPDASATGRFIEVNDRACHYLGYSREELLQMSVPQIDAPETLADVPAILRKLFEEGRATWEGIHVSKDGRKIPVEISNQLFELYGKPMILSAVRDITERKRTEEAVKLEAQLLDAATDSIFLLDLEGNLIYVNEAAYKSHGYTKDELMAMKLHDLDVLEHGKLIEPRMKELMEKGEATFESAHFRKDGSIMPIEVHARIIEVGANKFVLSITRDITERKRAEESLRLNESRLEALLKLNHMPDASLKEVSDFALEEAIRLTGSKIGYLAFMNDDETVLTMYSWSKSALEECRIADKPLIYPVETTGLWGEALRQRKPIITNDYTAQNPWKKGYPKDHVEVVRHMNAPIFDGDHIVIVAGVGNKLSDYDTSDVRQLTLLMEGMWRIIQRKLTKEALRKERDKAQKYLDIAGVILVAIDAEQKVTLINKRGTEILGYPEQEIIGKNWFDNFVPERDRNSVKTLFAKLMAGEIKPVKYFENSVLIKSGEEKIIAWQTTLLKDESGNIVETLSSGEDVTESRQARKEMTFLASIVEHIPDAICSMDLNGNIVSWNEGAEKMLGYTAEEILGRPFAITVPNGLTRKELDHCISILNAEGFFTGYESLRLAKDGEIIPVEITAVALKDEEQNIIYYTSIMRNISKRKTAQEDVKKRVKELEDFYDMAVGRELRMKELKEEMEDLKEEIERLKQELDKYKKQ